VLLGADEREVKLPQLCASGPALLVFLRHFG
jgi:hypothetical protein